MDIIDIDARLTRLEEYFPQEDHHALVAEYQRFAAVVARVAFEMGLLRAEIVSESRHSSYVRARFVVIFLARNVLKLTYPQIGRLLGGRDHTTMINGYRRATAKRKAGDPAFKRLTDKLLVEFGGSAL